MLECQALFSVYKCDNGKNVTEGYWEMPLSYIASFLKLQPKYASRLWFGECWAIAPQFLALCHWHTSTFLEEVLLGAPLPLKR